MHTEEISKHGAIKEADASRPDVQAVELSTFANIADADDNINWMPRRYAPLISAVSGRWGLSAKCLSLAAPMQQREATKSAEESLQILTNRYIDRADPYLQVLTAQIIALENERNDVDILRRRMDANVLLIKALGAGWNISQLPNAAQVSQNGEDQAHQNIPQGN